MENSESKGLDSLQNVVVHEATESSPSSITYTKRGYGEKETQRPIGAVRLEIALDEAKMTQTELAEKIKVRQPTISRIIDGTTKRSRYLPTIAKVLNKNVNWLAGIEPNDKNNAVINKNLLDINNHLFIIVPLYKNKDNDPSDNINESILKESTVMIAEGLIPKNIDPNSLKFIYETERAMSPEIKIGAAVTFNPLDTIVTSGDIFVVRIGDTISSRILFTQPNGEVLIRAKAEDFPEYNVRVGSDDFEILGRVIFVTNKY